jgi:hypothetical protein
MSTCQFAFNAVSFLTRIASTTEEILCSQSNVYPIGATF